MAFDFVLPRVVLGAMAFAPTERSLRIRTIHAALDAGVTAVDTAPLYGLGASEQIVGDAITDRRARVQVWSKVGLRWDGEHGDVLLKAEGKTVRKDSRPASIRRDVEESLGRLGIDRLDLCQVHHHDRLVPIADTMGELVRLREEGKIDAIGVSNFDAGATRQAAEALGDVRLATHQGRYNLLHREAEATLWATLDALSVAFVAYSPLAQGLLTVRPGRRLDPQDWRRWLPAFHPVNRRRVGRACETLHAVAAREGISVARLALAWVLAQRSVAAVVVGGSRPEQIRDSALAARTELCEEARREVANAFATVRLLDDPPDRRRDRIRRFGGRVMSGLARRVTRPRR